MVSVIFRRRRADHGAGTCPNNAALLLIATVYAVSPRELGSPPRTMLLASLLSLPFIILLDVL